MKKLTYPKVQSREDSQAFHPLSDNSNNVGFVSIPDEGMDPSKIEGDLRSRMQRLKTSIPNILSQFFAYQYALELWAKHLRESKDFERTLVETNDTNVMVSECLDVFELIFWWLQTRSDTLTVLDEDGHELTLSIENHENLVKQFREMSNDWRGEMGQELFATAFVDSVVDNGQLTDNAVCFARFADSPEKWLGANRNFEQDPQSFHDVPYYLIMAGDKVIACTSPVSGFALPFDKPGPITLSAELTGKEEVRLFDPEQPRSPYDRSIGFQKFFNAFCEANAVWLDKNMPLQDLGNLKEVYLAKLRDFDPDVYEQIRPGERNKAYTQEDFTRDYGIVNLYISPGEEPKRPMISIWGQLAIFPYNNKVYKADQPENKEMISQKSDFALANGFEFDGLRPLVLKEGFDREDWLYIPENFFWKRTYEVKSTGIPLSDLNRRSLAGFEQIAYPNLTIDDFLNDTIFSLPYPMDQEAFLMPNYVSEGSNKEREIIEGNFIIPPIKEDFFKILGFDGLEMLTITTRDVLDDETDNSEIQIKVKLEIPVQREGENLVLERYYKRGENWIELGSVEAFDLTYYPDYFTGDPTYDKYWVMLVRAEVEKIASLRFFKLTDKLLSEVEVKDENKEDRSIRSTHYHIEQRFNLIQLELSTGDFIYLAPNFKDKTRSIASGAELVVSVDFGTTNTHMEVYTQSGAGGLELLEIGENQSTGISHIHLDGADKAVTRSTRNYQHHEIFPSYFGLKHHLSFPIRTCIAVGRKWRGDKLRLFLDGNIYTCFGKQEVYKDLINLSAEDLASILDTRQNLKWDEENEARKLFIMQLALWMKDIIISKGHNPRNSKIIWYYPLSLDNSTKEKIEKEWGDALGELGVTDKKRNLIDFSESISPYLYFKKEDSGRNKTLFHDNNVLIMDTGGGSSDMALIPKGDQRIFSFSSVLAGNVLFDEEFSGFYQYLKERFEYLTQNRNSLDELRALEELVNNPLEFVNTAIRIPDFEFHSISNHANPKLKALRLAILFHFSANIYYSALFSYGLKNVSGENEVIKAFRKTFLENRDTFPSIISESEDSWEKAAMIPSTILLTGNGSRIYWLLSTAGDTSACPSTKDFSLLSSFCTAIYKYIFGRMDVPDLKIQSTDNPKMITVKGGIEGYNEKQSRGNSNRNGKGPREDIQKFVIGSLGKRSVALDKKSFKSELGDVKMADNFEPSMANIDSEVVQEVKDSVKEFIELFFVLLEKQQNLGRNRYYVPFDDLDFLKEQLLKKTEEYMQYSLDDWKDRTGKEPLSMAPFFFPLPLLVSFFSDLAYQNS